MGICPECHIYTSNMRRHKKRLRCRVQHIARWIREQYPKGRRQRLMPVMPLLRRGNPSKGARVMGRAPAAPTGPVVGR